MRFDPDLSIYKDGCFPDAPLILTDDEYFDKVLFDKVLVQATRFFHWVINNRQGYIQKGEFRKNLEWALVYERHNDEDGNEHAVAFNLGDLLIYVPLDERLKWKQFFQRADINIDYADKLLLLFFDKNNDQESGLVQKYWTKRIENLVETEDLPWWTKRQKEQVAKELHELKQPDPKTGDYRDIKLKFFKREVLDKYRNNDLCDIESNYISFLQHDKNAAASTVRFDSRDFVNIRDVLMVQAQEYIYVPPQEKTHWEQYEIPESEIQFQ